MASAGTRAYIRGSGAEPPAGVRGAELPVGVSPPKTDDILVLSTHFCAVLEFVVAADLTEATRQWRIPLLY